MPTFKIKLAYDGTAYAGWQVQDNAETIQGRLESALLRITGKPLRVSGSGRTDAGVHALGQVASFHVATRLGGDEMRRALNGNLPQDIRVHDCDIAYNGFNALRDAVAKRYCYYICDGNASCLFLRQHRWHVFENLDDAAMQIAGNHLQGRHDFSSFEATGAARKSSVRNVTELSLKRKAGEWCEYLRIDVCADGFLYNMVRNIVGTLVEVGRGAKPIEWVHEVLHQKDRRTAGPTAPACGLFLVQVDYDE